MEPPPLRPGLSFLSAAVFLFVMLVLTIIGGLGGSSILGLLRSAPLVGVFLTPLWILPRRWFRAPVPTLRKDVLFFVSVLALGAIVFLRLSQFGGTTSGDDLTLGALAAASFLGAIASLSLLDLVRSRSMRLAVVAILLFVSLQVELPRLGFEQAEDCLNDHVAFVLEDPESYESISGSRDALTGDGQCGTVSWRLTRFRDTHGPQVTLYGTGGFLSGDSLVWSERPIDDCTQTTIARCRSVELVFDGWYTWTTFPVGAT